ncbi:MAG: tyrosine-protein phosphatase [bacterium]|nr:tyrosine-protein phosphatase [bacterium]
MVSASIKPITGNPIICVMDKLWTNKKPFYMQKVSDSFYRGSQAGEAEFQNLSKEGIKTILNLKTIKKKELETLSSQAKKFGIDYINIPLDPFNITKSLPNLLDVINKATKENPLFVHCTFGRDRTGFVTGLNKYLNDNVPMKEVIKDMKAHGFRETLFFHMEKYLKQIDKMMGKIKP